jgi:hypothetical protein
MQMTELTLRDVDAPNFCEARDQAQNVAQWLARMAQSFAVSDGHSPACELFWASDTRTIRTPEIAPATVLELRLPELTLQFSEGGVLVPHRLEVEEKSSTEIEAWLRVEMLHRGFDREKFSTELPYHWPKLMSGDEKKYCPESLETELRLLTEWFQNASTILLNVKNRLRASLEGDANFMIAASDADTSERLKCWPDRFDIGFHLSAVEESDRGAPLIKVAFTAGDENNAEPRFFVSSASADPVILPAARPIGSEMTVEDGVGYLIAQAHERMKAMLDGGSRRSRDDRSAL